MSYRGRNERSIYDLEQKLSILKQALVTQLAVEGEEMFDGVGWMIMQHHEYWTQILALTDDPFNELNAQLVAPAVDLRIGRLPAVQEIPGETHEQTYRRMIELRIDQMFAQIDRVHNELEEKTDTDMYALLSDGVQPVHLYYQWIEGLHQQFAQDSTVGPLLRFAKNSLDYYMAG